MSAKFSFKRSYANLPRVFYSPARGQATPKAELALFNHALAAALGLNAEDLTSPEGLAMLSGNAFPEDAAALAMAYAGHQFGHFTMLGDGRALLLGEWTTPEGELVDLHLKGSGPTAYSRRGDGKAALGPMLREYLISEAMHNLGIPTTRSLAVIATGEWIQRETPLPGAVLTRVAKSHIRVGTLQFASALAQEDPKHLEDLKALLDFTILRHYPKLSDHPNPGLATFEAIVARQAALVAQWQQVGFIHGVLNTDNTALSGETIDYGPCAFMDTYHPNTVFSSIDHYGRYAYHQQPNMVGWNLARLAEAMAPLFDPSLEQAKPLAEAAIAQYPIAYQAHYHRRFAHKLGLSPAPEHHGDTQRHIRDFLAFLQENALDFTESFLYITLSASHHPVAAAQARRYGVLSPWLVRLEGARREQQVSIEEALQAMQDHNPAVIPRNQWVEAALRDCQAGDYSRFNALLELLQAPYAYRDDQLAMAFLPEVDSAQQQKYRTFCGT